MTGYRCVLIVLSFLLPVFGQKPSPTPSVPQLDRQIDATLRHHKYAWVGAAPLQPSKKSLWGPLQPIRKLLDRIEDSVNNGLRSFVRWLDRLFSQNRDLRVQEKPPPPGRVPVWLLASLGGAALLVAAILFFRRAKPTGLPVAPPPPAALAVLEDEQTLASALPEQEWLRLANDYFEKGNGRLAVRALHLAELAFLADRGLITITQYKTTADYRAELRRRARSQPVTDLFARNGLRYESTWYGVHEASRELIETFGDDLRALRELTHA